MITMPIIPKDATNGDVIKIMFPNGIDIYDLDWWDAPYKMEIEEQPPADVVPREDYKKLLSSGLLKDCEMCEMKLRSKIDKAIKRIEQNSVPVFFKYDGELATETEIIEINKVLEILKRNIGE